MAAGQYYYIQGFRISNTKTSIQFVQSLYENNISTGNKVIITFKPGATAADFASVLPVGITIVDSERKLTSVRVTLLQPIIIKLNNFTIRCFDLENRVLNYLVSYDRESLFIETSHHTAFVIFHEDVEDEVWLRNFLDQSIYFYFLGGDVPVGETFSYPLVNTSSSLRQINSEDPRPLYFSKYTKYRLEYSKILLGFYDALKLQVPGFEIYLGEDKIGTTENDIDSDRISIILEGIGDQERRPYMLDKDLQPQVASMLLRLQTSDMLKYNHIKNAYQNLTMISNLARFNVKDTKNLDWMTHIEWSPVKDTTRMSEIRDDMGRFSYVLDMRCELYYYVVTDELYRTIQVIDINYIITGDTRAHITVPSTIITSGVNSHTHQAGDNNDNRPIIINNNDVVQEDNWDTNNW